MAKQSTQYKLLSRRNLLKSAALMTLLAPVLRASDAIGGGPTAPRRVILVSTPNGPMVAAGPATGTEKQFTLHDWWKPLDPYKNDAIFFSHLCPTGSSIVPGPNDNGLAAGHGLGAQTFAGFGTMADDQYSSAGESIDQTIGKRLESEGRSGRVRSVAWGLQSGWVGPFWAGPALSLATETDPSKAWAQVFATPGGDDPAALLREKSMLDFVSNDCGALRDALGTEGMRLLDDHCTTIRQMEKNVGTSLACATPMDPGSKDWTNPEIIDAQMAAFVDLMALTLVCEATHVMAFQFGTQAARLQIASSYGVPSSGVVDSGDSGPAHHPWTHNKLSDPETQLALGIFQKFYSQKVASMIDKLKTTIDASGKPLLDSTAVLWLSELGGNENNMYDGHICSSIPAVLFGNGQGTFKTGRYIKGPSEDVADPGNAEGGRMTAQLLVSMMQYMGLNDVTTVGKTGVNGPLSLLY